MFMLAKIKQWVKVLKQQVIVVWLVARDDRTPVFIKMLAFFFAAYALSPIDLIPDFIPIICYLDDMIIVPLGLFLVIKCTPDTIIQDCRTRALSISKRPVSRWAACIIIILWCTLLLLLFNIFLDLYLENENKIFDILSEIFQVF
ncbi:YkvA family protein [Acinetobacter stercoris]|uniref:DUF1232 domain-containing protein n=1 Tax=Acinetobacter stercoris TaxID=2126983 RepID=A0A2U3N2L1_9GAMM|nr:YkvA family protein [Acinetobacter stercoris]SPL71911.1 hypothetical protein KPC_3089 [Acinetobacter stercoris]